MNTQIVILGDEPLVLYNGYPMSHWLDKAKFRAKIKITFSIFIALAIAVMAAEFDVQNYDGLMYLMFVIYTKNSLVTVPLSVGVDVIEVIINAMINITFVSIIISYLHSIYSRFRINRNLSPVIYNNNYRYEPNKILLKLIGFVFFMITVTQLEFSFIFKFIITFSVIANSIVSNSLLLMLNDSMSYVELVNSPLNGVITNVYLGEVHSINIDDITINELDKAVIPLLNEAESSDDY